MDTEITDVPPHGRGMPLGIPLDSILPLAEKGLTHTQIAKLVGCDRSNISRRLRTHEVLTGQIKEYVTDRANILASIQWRLLSSITDDEIKKAPLGTRLMCFGILYDKERLERGQTTENVGIAIAGPILERIVSAYQAPQPDPASP